MKKKILLCSLCFTIIFSSLNIKRSYANPLIGKVAEVSIIYGIGRIAMDLVGFAGDISDLMQLGSDIYSKMSDKEKEDFKNNVKYDNDGFTYEDDAINSISSYIPNRQYHYMAPFKIRFETKYYHDTADNTSNIDNIFNENSIEYKYQGHTIKLLTYTYPYSNTKLNYRTYYSFNGSNLTYFSHRSDKDIEIYLDLYVELWQSLGNPKVYIKGDYYYNGYLKSTTFFSDNDSCSNCPHDISLKDKYDKPTQEEQDFIEKYYPQYENDIPTIGGGSTGGGSNGGGSTGGGSNGGGSNGDINNPVISNPPSFPDLQEFDFSGLQLEPLTNLFSNFKNKFPFSLPFDLANLLGGLKQEPIPPVFETELLGETMKLDLTQFSELANLVRMFTVLSYIIGLILLTKRFGG